VKRGEYNKHIEYIWASAASSVVAASLDLRNFIKSRYKLIVMEMNSNERETT